MRAGRLITLMLALQRRGRLTAAQLAVELEVSERTVLRDIEALSGAGVPVYATRGPGGGFQLLDGYTSGLTSQIRGPQRAMRSAPRTARPRASAEEVGLAAVLGSLRPRQAGEGPPADGMLSGMDRPTPKENLHRYLRGAREALLWKLDGLSEHDARRPLVPTGTNLLGLVKHLAAVEQGYFGSTFGRPFAERLEWFEDGAEPNADMWATADESRQQIVGLYHRACAHADDTIDALRIDAVGQVPWWPDGQRDVTLHTILIHVIAETNRHVGHADIVRELIDGAAGLRAGNDNMAPGDPTWWRDHHHRVEQAAQEAGRR